MSRLSAYYHLTKPGIIRGNLLTAVAGYFLAVQHGFYWPGFIGLVIGLGLVIASACVANNYLDRGIDARMQRTQKRALVTGTISHFSALTYCILLGSSGVAVLVWLTTPLAVALAVIGWLFYVFLYGYAKRRTIFSTLIGAIPGALPPVIGYAAVNGPIDQVAVLLFVILVSWQLPHFYAIAIYRQAYYQAAGIPLMPARRGWSVARRRITAYIIAYCILVPTLTHASEASTYYLLLSTALALVWLYQALRPATDDVKWARRCFGWSLFAITIWSLAIVFDAIL